jgi:hypothetical protein
MEGRSAANFGADCVRMRQMNGHGSKFGRKKEEAIAALLTQRNIEEAARSIGVAPNTLLKWQKLPEFEIAYREARKAAYRQAVARLQQGTSAAATTLLVSTGIKQPHFHRFCCWEEKPTARTRYVL